MQTSATAVAIATGAAPAGMGAALTLFLYGVDHYDDEKASIKTAAEASNKTLPEAWELIMRTRIALGSAHGMGSVGEEVTEEDVQDAVVAIALTE